MWISLSLLFHFRCSYANQLGRLRQDDLPKVTFATSSASPAGPRGSSTTAGRDKSDDAASVPVRTPQGATTSPLLSTGGQKLVRRRMLLEKCAELLDVRAPVCLAGLHCVPGLSLWLLLVPCYWCV